MMDEKPLEPFEVPEPDENGNYWVVMKTPYGDKEVPVEIGIYLMLDVIAGNIYQLNASWANVNNLIYATMKEDENGEV